MPTFFQTLQVFNKPQPDKYDMFIDHRLTAVLWLWLILFLFTPKVCIVLFNQRFFLTVLLLLFLRITDIRPLTAIIIRNKTADNPHAYIHMPYISSSFVIDTSTVSDIVRMKGRINRLQREQNNVSEARFSTVALLSIRLVCCDDQLMLIAHAGARVFQPIRSEYSCFFKPAEHAICKTCISDLPCLCLPASLSLSLSTSLSLYLCFSAYLSQPACLSVSLPICFYLCLCLPVSFCLSASLCLSISVCPSLSWFLPLSISVCLSVCLPAPSLCVVFLYAWKPLWMPILFI